MLREIQPWLVVGFTYISFIDFCPHKYNHFKSLHQITQLSINNDARRQGFNFLPLPIAAIDFFAVCKIWRETIITHGPTNAVTVAHITVVNARVQTSDANR
jgi:hypothetical protein